MKVVIPMAGRGTRLRPHTLLLPKPLLKIAGKTIIEWIIEEIDTSTNSTIEEIHFIIGDFGKSIEDRLIGIAESVGAKGFIHYQLEALGTAHAIYSAKDALYGEVFIAFADTIFKGKIEIDSEVDGIIWTMEVDYPENYGVVIANEDSIITDFIEKPKNRISNNAIVGLYYFKRAENLLKEIDDLIVNNRKENNEFQITNCLESLKNNGSKIKCAKLDEWLDCGNKAELLNTNKRLLELNYNSINVIKDTCQVENSEIDNTVFIDENVRIENSIIKNSIVYEGSVIKNSFIVDSIIGSFCNINGLEGKIYLGDYSEYEKV